MSAARVKDAELKSAVAAATEGEVDLTGVSAELARRAAAAGLLDLAYCELDSPLGKLLAVASPDGLIKLGYPNVAADAQLAGLAEAVSPRLLEAPGEFDELRRELGEYFEGERRDFAIELDWRLTAGFVQRVLRQTARIPFGQTRTYSEMAASAGSPRAHRAAGSALGANPIPIVVPCHRVLRAGGALGGYGGGLEVKRRLLELEGALQD